MTDHTSAAFGSAASGPAKSGSAAPARAEMPKAEAARYANASVSAAIVAANAQLSELGGFHGMEPGPRFPAEDGGRSLTAMAELDLDATLQLLAERAQYITGASGTAIALRRGAHKDMLCRASAGSNAPELGALLSMEYGLSGESVRTLQILRCDDTERDARVNREGCRQLGIASVVVMPVVCEEQAIGVFELFSGKPNAFGDRDVVALRRLSEMVETAVKHAAAMQNVAEGVPAAGVAEMLPQVAARVGPDAPRKVDAAKEHSEAVLEPSEKDVSPQFSIQAKQAEVIAPSSPAQPEAQSARGEAIAVKTAETAEPLPVEEEKARESLPQKPLFWTAAAQRARSGITEPTAAVSAGIAVPAVLRNLQKCQACGFPVSQGRTLCVECEQKKWRGEPLAQPAAIQAPQGEAEKDAVRQTAELFAASDEKSSVESVAGTDVEEASRLKGNLEAAGSVQADASSPGVSSVLKLPEPEATTSATGVKDLPPQNLKQEDSPMEDSARDDAEQPLTEATDNSAVFLSSAMPSESWFAANKYVLAVLLVVAVVIAAIWLLH
jgi:hypothetical protein